MEIIEQPPRCLGRDWKDVKFDIRHKVGILFAIFSFLHISEIMF